MLVVDVGLTMTTSGGRGRWTWRWKCSLANRLLEYIIINELHRPVLLGFIHCLAIGPQSYLLNFSPKAMDTLLDNQYTKETQRFAITSNKLGSASKQENAGKHRSEALSRRTR